MRSEVKIFNIQDSKLDRTIEYESSNESLFEILKKYDPSVGKHRCRVAIGSNLFHDWTIPIEVCVAYGDSISISYRPKPKNHEYIVYVKTLTGVMLSIIVDSNMTIDELKKEIQYMEGISIYEQRLLFAGKRLEDDMSLNDYKIKPESTLDLEQKVYGGGFEFANLAESGVKIGWSQKAPKWRGVSSGLSFEGKCTNPEWKRVLQI
jgi:large subunit ribosomal protein L40e